MIKKNYALCDSEGVGGLPLTDEININSLTGVFGNIHRSLGKM